MLFLSFAWRYRHGGSLKLLCSNCRYVIRKMHIPILGVDCNSNPRHKQWLSGPPPRSRSVPAHVLPFLEGKQYPRHPMWKQEWTQFATRKKHMQLDAVRRN